MDNERYEERPPTVARSIAAAQRRVAAADPRQKRSGILRVSVAFRDSDRSSSDLECPS